MVHARPARVYHVHRVQRVEGGYEMMMIGWIAVGGLLAVVCPVMIGMLMKALRWM